MVAQRTTLVIGWRGFRGGNAAALEDIADQVVFADVVGEDVYL